MCIFKDHLGSQTVNNLPAMQKIPFRSLGREDSLEKRMVTHSSILAGRIPWTEEPDGLESPKELDTTEQLTHTQANIKLE